MPISVYRSPEVAEGVDEIYLLGLKNNRIPVSWTIDHNNNPVAYSYWSDKRWYFPVDMFPGGTPVHKTFIDFSWYEQCYLDDFKLLIFKYLKSGVRGATIIRFAKEISTFFKHLHSNGIESISSIRSIVCTSYIQSLYAHRKRCGRPLSKDTIRLRLHFVEILYQLCVETDFEFEVPWPNNTSDGIAKIDSNECKTEPIPQTELKKIFREASRLISGAKKFLELNQSLEIYRNTLEKKYSEETVRKRLNQFVIENSEYDSLRKFKEHLYTLPTAVIVVILTLSGMRIHEVLNIETNCMRETTDQFGVKTYWLSSISTKTGVGRADWVVPKAVKKAIKIQELLSRPLRKKMHAQLEALGHDYKDLQVREFIRNAKDRLFLSEGYLGIQKVTPLSQDAVLHRMSVLYKAAGASEFYRPHQYRRTFALYVASSSLGDIRYLRKHFKHWSMDMTLMYARSKKKDQELVDQVFSEITDKKKRLLKSWALTEDTLAGGGMGQVQRLRSQFENVTTFESRKKFVQKVASNINIRATGIGWCTADSGSCLGPTTFDRTRCYDCVHSIIDKSFSDVWKGIYQQQVELLKIEGLGRAGSERVERDVARSKSVLVALDIAIEN